MYVFFSKKAFEFSTTKNYRYKKVLTIIALLLCYAIHVMYDLQKTLNETKILKCIFVKNINREIGRYCRDAHAHCGIIIVEYFVIFNHLTLT